MIEAAERRGGKGCRRTGYAKKTRLNNIPYKSYQEYLKHPKFKAIRKEVMKRANGICEKCGQRPATEPHHLKYPKWGTFDVIENLIAVCHSCHCKIHGVKK